jgi:hypothetical protein
MISLPNTCLVGGGQGHKRRASGHSPETARLFQKRWEKKYTEIPFSYLLSISFEDNKSELRLRVYR